MRKAPSTRVARATDLALIVPCPVAAGREGVERRGLARSVGRYVWGEHLAHDRLARSGQ